MRGANQTYDPIGQFRYSVASSSHFVHFFSSGRRIKTINLLVVLLGCLSLFYCAEPLARTEISIGSGYGAAHIVPVRLGLQKEFEKKWRPKKLWPIGGYLEGSIYSMNGKKGPKPGSHSHLEAGALAGVIRFEREKESIIGTPYVELGIGLSWLSQKEIGGRDLGIHFQFEDRAGIGVRFGKNQEYDFGYKAIHFSNAYLGPSNQGINLHMLVLGYWFN